MGAVTLLNYMVDGDDWCLILLREVFGLRVELFFCRMQIYFGLGIRSTTLQTTRIFRFRLISTGAIRGRLTTCQTVGSSMRSPITAPLPCTDTGAKVGRTSHRWMNRLSSNRCSGARSLPLTTSTFSSWRRRGSQASARYD